MSKISSAAFADTKPHYDILDGLRGVAAIMVVWFHLFEAYATSHLDQRINHGYLAVDFFFILSGFVIGYAYDDRWKKKMSVKDFLKRRLIRLHPMVVMGAVIGAVMFYFQGCSVWDVSAVSLSMLLTATLLNALLIPATPGSEIRGLGEMYPLNGPSWSLFFEYIGNVLYALFIRKLPTRALSVLVLLAGCGLAAFAVWGPLGDICVGFAMDGDNMLGGSLRLLFAFSAGLLLSRVFKPVRIRGAFWICALAIVTLLSVPRIGGSEHLWMNGLYDTLCAVVLFPLLVCLGASGKTTDRVTTRDERQGAGQGLREGEVFVLDPGVVEVDERVVHHVQRVGNIPQKFADPGSVILAYLCLKLYDEPVRRFLTDRFLRRKK